MLQAGFSDRIITPSSGKQIPGLFERRLARGVADDLYARALVVDDGKTLVALVQVDAISFPEALVAGARKRAQALCGIEAKNCFIAATHTHSGGAVFDGFMTQGDPAYGDFLIEQVAMAIAEAHRLRRPALMGIEQDSAKGVAFNRRFHLKNGDTRTHPGKLSPEILQPAGPADPTVTVLGFADPDSYEPFGCLVHFACHATHMNGELYSADYVKWVVDSLKAQYGPGFGLVYQNGACGDVTQVDNQSARPDEFGPYWAARTGRVIAGGAFQALSRMDYYQRSTVAVDRIFLRLPIRDIDQKACAAARKLLKSQPISAENVETIYANELLEVDKMRKKNPVRRLEIMGLRLAEACFWSAPAELFQAFALQVQQNSPFPYTCCVELANGYNGYVCTEEAFSGGGYEIRTARSSFLCQDAGPRIVKGAGRLLTRMHHKDARPLKKIAGEHRWPAYEDPSALDGIQQIAADST